MGGTTTLMPSGWPQTGYDGTGWSYAGGAANPAVALSDLSDSTYATDTAAGAADTRILIKLGGGSVPAGAAIKSVTPRVRASQSTGTKKLSGKVLRNTGGDAGLSAYSTPQTAFLPTNLLGNFTLPAGGELNLSQAASDSASSFIGQLWWQVTLNGGGKASDDHRVYNLYADVAYVDAPSIASLGLVDSGDLTKTTRPRFSWLFSSDDGLTQYEVRAAVWAQSDVAAYPGGRAAFEAAAATNAFTDATGAGGASGPGFNDGSANRYAKAWSILEGSSSSPGWDISSDGQWVPPQDLPPTGAMTVYLQVSAQFAGSRLPSVAVSAYDFTMNVVPPAQPSSVAAAWQAASYRTKVDVAVPLISSYGAFTGRRVYVEHALSGSSDWKPLPTGMQEAGLAAATYTFYDSLTPTNRQVKYRAKVELYDSTSKLASSWTYFGRANFVLNPNFDADTANWVGLTNCTISRTTSEGAVGSVTAALQMASVASGAYNARHSITIPVTPGQLISAQARFKAQVTSRTCSVFLQFFQANAFTLVSNSTQAQASDATGSWTTVTLNGVTVPANAAWAAVTLQVGGSAAGEVHWADGVIVEPGAATIASYGDGDTASWAWLGAADASASYLASTVDCQYDQLVLRDPLVDGSQLAIKWLGDMESSSGEVLGEFRALKGTRPIFVSDAVMGSRWQAQALLAGTAAKAAFDSLRSASSALVLNSDMTDMWWWVSIGPDVRYRLLRQANRRTTPTWIVDFELVETYPVPGQPGVWVA